MQPVVHSADTKLDGWELLNMEFTGKAGVKINQFFSVDYLFNARKQPLLIDDWQVTNSLLVTIGFELIHPTPAAPEAAPCPVCPEVKEPECPDAACPDCPACECPEPTAPVAAEEPPADAAPTGATPPTAVSAEGTTAAPTETGPAAPSTETAPVE
jgi:hypothetical protein